MAFADISRDYKIVAGVDEKRVMRLVIAEGDPTNKCR
jgi:hypothetical protein